MAEQPTHEITENPGPHYEPFGWHHWPEHPWISYQFRRAEFEGILGNMRCPYMIVHGGHDVLSVEQTTKAYEHAKESGVDMTLKLFSEEETGAEHCQHDNPTTGEEYMFDWLADRFGIDQRQLLARNLRP